MSALTLFNTDKLPAYLKSIKLDDASLSLLSGGGVPKISIKGNVFRKIVAGEEVMKNEDRSMNMIIINTAPVEYRTFYAGVYKEGENKGPSCWSSTGEVPDSAIKNPQSPSCATCPQNIKGSGQGDSRACRFSRYVSVVLENDLEGDIMQLVLPSQSVFGKGEKGKLPLRQYAKFLAAHGLPITTVVTEVRFDTDSATPKLTFKPIRPLTEEEYSICSGRVTSVEAMEAISMSFKPQDDSADEADEDTMSVLKAAAAMHTKATDTDDEVEPKVRGKTKPEAVTSVLDQWADDDEE
jgi:hypothetical protein